MQNFVDLSNFVQSVCACVKMESLIALMFVINRLLIYEIRVFYFPLSNIMFTKNIQMNKKGRGILRLTFMFACK